MFQVNVAQEDLNSFLMGELKFDRQYIVHFINCSRMASLPFTIE